MCFCSYLQCNLKLVYNIDVQLRTFPFGEKGPKDVHEFIMISLRLLLTIITKQEGKLNDTENLIYYSNIIYGQRIE